MPDTTLEILMVFMRAVIAERKPRRRLALLNRMVQGAKMLEDTAEIADSEVVREDKRSAAEWLRANLPALMR